jgi:hypothetical protein
MIEVGDTVALVKNWEHVRDLMDAYYIRSDSLQDSEGPFVVSELSGGVGRHADHAIKVVGGRMWQGKKRFYKVGENT